LKYPAKWHICDVSSKVQYFSQHGSSSKVLQYLQHHYIHTGLAKTIEWLCCFFQSFMQTTPWFTYSSCHCAFWKTDILKLLPFYKAEFLSC
jgi:hypothetical protein